MPFSKTLLRSRWIKAYLNLLFFLEKFIGPLFFLSVRIWIARIFWDSGICKIQSWPTTLMLFENEYKVPDLSPTFAAYLATFIELTCPVLITIGFAFRLAAFPMLIMTLVIQCTYLCVNEHIYWGMILGLIICYGPGAISCDFFIRKWLLKGNSSWKSF
ncbi:MAG: DoxX family protein [Alphaproteobacteria bacterium]|nr:DoxX family protein [Alphaproteobacteria bacterium]